MRYFILSCFILLIKLSISQTYTIKGTVKDSVNGEDVYGATIKVMELENAGAKTNTYGFYSLTLEMGTYTLLYRSRGFAPKKYIVELNKNTSKKRRACGKQRFSKY